MLHMGEVQVESALLFETPAEIYARVFRALKPRTPLPEIQVEFCRFANANSFIRLESRPSAVAISGPARRRAGPGHGGAGLHPPGEALPARRARASTTTATGST